MAVKQIRVVNFESFSNLDLELGQFNVLIGANASGKSNFVNVFRFLKNIQSFGLDNAVSMQGGVQFLRNLTIGHDKNVSIEVTFGPELRSLVAQMGSDEFVGIKATESIYRFAIRSNKSGSNFSIVDDQLIMKGEFHAIRPHRRKGKIQEEKVGEGEIIVSVSSETLRGEIKFAKREKALNGKKLQVLLNQIKLPPKTLLFQAPFVAIPIGRNIAIYDFDPKLPQKATPITGKVELEEDGSNLAIVLQKILDSSAKKRQFSNLMENLLPFVDTVKIEKFADRSLMFEVKEIYFKNRFLPASSLSDGTINIAALIVALYFSSQPLTIIEEPERNIHPNLISKVVNMMKDASRKKQILVTTQNTEIVKHAGLENLLCVRRDKDGVSTISRLGEQQELQKFLTNEIGIETLYVQNILECTK